MFPQLPAAVRVFLCTQPTEDHGKDSGKKPNRVNLLTIGGWEVAENLEIWPRAISPFWHRPSVSNMTGGRGRFTRTDIRSTFCQAASAQGLTDVYPVGFFTRILTDVLSSVVLGCFANFATTATGGRTSRPGRSLITSRDRRVREGRVMLHRAVMSVVLGRQLGRDEFVCHRDDDPRNNWPDNLYLGDPQSNAADSVRNGGRLRGDSHPSTKIWDAQVREIRSALARGERVGALARAYGVHKSTVSRIKHGVRRRSC